MINAMHSLWILKNASKPEQSEHLSKNHNQNQSHWSMDHQRIRLTKNQQQVLYRRWWWLKYLWWEKYYVMSKIFIKSHLPCLYASLVHILWTLLMLSPTARLKSDLCNKQSEIYFPTFLFIVELMINNLCYSSSPDLLWDSHWCISWCKSQTLTTF